eukprot:c29596_g1_i1 orf=136-789(-)
MGLGRMERVSLLLLLLLICLVQHTHRLCEGLQITVQNTDCVYENVEYEGDLVTGNYVVIDHEYFWSEDHPGIDFSVTAPAGTVVLSHQGTSGEKFEFRAARRGAYKFCFHNKGSAPENIAFYVHVGHIPNDHDLAKDEHLNPVNVKIAELREALEAVSAEQQYLRARDLRHRYTVESTQRRLLGYTLAEYLALVVASVSQVFLIRRMFNKRVGYNRV